MSDNHEAIRDRLCEFNDEGGTEKLDEIKDNLSSAYGDMHDLIGKLKRLEDAMDESDDEAIGDLVASLPDLISSLEEAVDCIDKAHDRMVYANTDLIFDISQI